MNRALVDILVFGVPLAFLFAWGFGDLYILLRERPRDPDYPTITRRIQRLSSEYIVIPFLAGLIIGLICGHLFGSF